jgi:phosphoribosylformylglycinamidine synthase
MIKIGIVIFPGATCENDCFYVLKEVLKQRVEFLWYSDKITNLEDFGCIILPGGFSYGDYLRAGAIAALSRIMDSLFEFSQKDRLILGICNGFQILLEAGLLEGAMLRNNTQKFICKYVNLLVENKNSPFTHILAKDNKNKKHILNIPIAHMEGNYYIDEAGLNKLIKNDQILLRYCDTEGNCTDSANPNGSVYNIAGILNEKKNIAGMMPHPERACEPILGSVDGLVIFESIIKYLS